MNFAFTPTLIFVFFTSSWNKVKINCVVLATRAERNKLTDKKYLKLIFFASSYSTHSSLALFFSCEAQVSSKFPHSAYFFGKCESFLEGIKSHFVFLPPSPHSTPTSAPKQATRKRRKHVGENAVCIIHFRRTWKHLVRVPIKLNRLL